VIVRFVNIGGIADHNCLHFLFMIFVLSMKLQRKWIRLRITFIIKSEILSKAR